MKTKKNPQSSIGKMIMVILFLTLTGSLVFLYQKNKTNFIGTKISQIPMKVKTINEETKLYKIKAEYPVFGDNLDQLNKEIEKDITSRIDEFKQQSKDNWEDLKKFQKLTSEYPESPFTFFLSWTPQQVNKNFISFVMDINWYTGGANMAQNIVTFNFNVQGNKAILLADLFPDEHNYLQVISAYVRSDLKKQFIANGTEEKYIAVEMLEEGTEPSQENFSRFTFDDKTITFYFPKYQVAPGASGPQKVIMPRNIQ